MSSLPRNMGEPPKAAMAPSVDTLVRVLRLLKVIATVLPASAPRIECGTSPVCLMAVLCWCAFWTSVVSSAGVRSAMERRWRGANGDVGGAAGEVE
jgi:cobalamin synthase